MRELSGVEVRGLGLGKSATVRRLDVLLWWNVVAVVLKEVYIIYQTMVGIGMMPTTCR